MAKNFPKLKNNPILECIVEVRFMTSLPEEIAFAIIYQQLHSSELFSSYIPLQQPILQLPLEVRKNDPNLKFQPCYQLVSENYSIGISSFSLLFSVKAPYNSFNDFLNIIKSAFNVIDSSIIKLIERISLRYVNKINDSIFDATYLNLTCPGYEHQNNDVVNLRLESQIVDSILTILQLNDNNQIQFNNNGNLSTPEKATLVDIDSIYFFDNHINSLCDKQLIQALDNLHDKTHEMFYSLFRKEYIKSKFDSSFEGIN